MVFVKEIVRGITASKGIAKGKARIILNANEISRVLEGDVLVARFTEPSFTIAMMKASAFVTDIGGICSHAAIIARELGVPCIVGAKNATTLIKEGKEVTVDADQGIVFSNDD